MTTRKYSKRTQSALEIDSLTLDTLGLPSHDLAKDVAGYTDLPRAEKDIVEREITELDKALITAGKARLAIGEHLFNIREVLEPKRMFTAFLIACTKFSKATAYRYIDIFTAAKSMLPAPVLQQAMLRGVERINLKAVQENPPPKTTNVVKIDDYLNTIQRAQPREVQTDPDVLQKECFAKIHSAVQHLPVSPKIRLAWIRELFGRVCADMGITAPVQITPVPVPNGHVTVKGRPPKKAVAAKTTAA